MSKDINLMPTDWAPYPGYYEKEYYDIRTKDGREIIWCWPNAGDFMIVNGKQEGRIKGEDVVEFKLTNLRRIFLYE